MWLPGTAMLDRLLHHGHILKVWTAELEDQVADRPLGVRKAMIRTMGDLDKTRLWPSENDLSCAFMNRLAFLGALVSEHGRTIRHFSS
jgi:hypothetical protein